MSKLLVMCEGSCEVAILDILLDAGYLSFTRDDLLDLRIFHARQLSDSILQPILGYCTEGITVFRVGDKLAERLSTKSVPDGKIESIEKYCTKPELEVLVLINEGLYHEYEKQKSSKMPKEFAKEKVKYNNKRFRATKEFYNLYYGKRPDVLVDNIVTYKEINHGHKKDEKFLADLLKRR